jgi:hypothetical protein
MNNTHYWNEAFKRYATKDWANKPTLLDNKGETYKDEIKTLIRLVALKF